MTAAFVLTLAVLGFAGAFASGLVGVGGAIVMIPLLLYVPPLLGVGSLDIKTVAGVTMAQVLTASVMGAWTHGSGAMLHRRLALWGGVAMALGSLAGAVGSRFVGGRVLLVVFALMATAALLLMFIAPVEPGPEAGGKTMPFNRAGAVGIPGAVGVMSGLVGAGGAFLLMPVLIGVMRVPVRLRDGPGAVHRGGRGCRGLGARRPNRRASQPARPRERTAMGPRRCHRPGSTARLDRRPAVGITGDSIALRCGRSS